LNNSTARM